MLNTTLTVNSTVTKVIYELNFVHERWVKLCITTSKNFNQVNYDVYILG